MHKTGAVAVAVAVAFALITIAPSSVAADKAAVAVALRVQRLYGKLKSYRAKFTQTYRNKVHKKKKVSAGKVAFARKGKLSFRYDKPAGNRVVSDGKKIKVYDRAARQMYERKVTKSQYPASLAFLSGKGKLVRDFKLRLIKPKRLKRGYVLEAVPLEATPAYRKVLMYVDGKTAKVRRVLIIDAQGNTNRFDFSKPVVNEKISDREFRFFPPAGTNIVKP